MPLLKNDFSHINTSPLETLSAVTTDSGRFYTSPSGKILPSVTTVLGSFKKESLEAWKRSVGKIEAERVAKKATSRGERFHTLIEEYLQNKPPNLQELMPDLKNMFIGVLPYLNKIDLIAYQEECLYDDTIGVAGRVDLIARYAGVPSIIDFKSSKEFKDEENIIEYFEQATCYSLLFEAMKKVKARQIVVIIGNESGNMGQAFVKNRNNYINSLLNKIQLYKNAHAQNS